MAHGQRSTSSATTHAGPILHPPSAAFLHPSIHRCHLFGPSRLLRPILAGPRARASSSEPLAAARTLARRAGGARAREGRTMAAVGSRDRFKMAAIGMNSRRVDGPTETFVPVLEEAAQQQRAQLLGADGARADGRRADTVRPVCTLSTPLPSAHFFTPPSPCPHPYAARVSGRRQS